MVLVEIVKQFFEENSPQNNSPDRTMVEEIVREQLAGTEAEIVTLKAQMEQMQQLLGGDDVGKNSRSKNSFDPFFWEAKTATVESRGVG